MGSGKHGHGHSHEKQHSHNDKQKKFLGCCYCSDTVRISSMLFMTFIFFLIELVVGQITKSISLTTDSFHMLSDALALVIGLLTAIISKRASTKNTFGWVRAEVLGPLINSVFLFSLCLGIVIEAIKRLLKPEDIEDIDLLLYVGIVGLLINLVGLVIFGHGHSHNVPHIDEIEEEEEEESDEDEIRSVKCTTMDSNNHNHSHNHQVIKLTDSISLTEQKQFVAVDSNKLKDEKSATKKNKKTRCHILSKQANMNMRAVFLHVLADALGSVIVIISALLNKFQVELGIPKKFIVLIDPILCLCLVGLILSTALPLLKESALILLQTVPKEIEVKQLKQDLVSKISGISSVHELHIWKLSGRKIIATAHITCHNSGEYMEIAAKIKKFFHEKGIHSTTIQPEFITNENEGPQDCILECKQDCNPNTCCGQTNVNSTPNTPPLNN